MNAVNYQKLYERTVAALGGRRPKLLLHVCCGPCAAACLEELSARFDVTIFFYNPNIAPAAEYDRRLENARRLVEAMPLSHPVRFLAGEYRPEDFLSAVKGLEGEPEGGARCRVCFALRLRAAARAAQEIGAEFFTTTLTTGPRKSAQTLYEVGKVIGEEAGVAYLPADFKKRGGYEHSLAVCAAYGIYRQNYCGAQRIRKGRLPLPYFRKICALGITARGCARPAPGPRARAWPGRDDSARPCRPRDPWAAGRSARAHPLPRARRSPPRRG